MKAKVKTTQQVVEVRLTDATGKMPTWTYESIDGTERYLGHQLTFEDLCDYKTWVEDLIKQIAVREYCDTDYVRDNRQQIANNIVLFAYAVMDRMQQESKTWR